MDAQIVGELRQLAERAPDLIATVEDWLDIRNIEGWISRQGERMVGEAIRLPGASASNR